MTPEEKAVIDAAIAERNSLWNLFATGANSPLIAAIDALIFSCPKCNAGGHVCPGDGNPISHTQSDCGDHGDLEPWEISPEPIEEWTPATLLYCLAGDRIRIGTDETKVLRSSSGVWYVNTENYWHPTPWQHTELRLELEANPGFQEYPPNLECEILMSPERRAVFALQQTFPGTSVIS